MYTEEKRMPSTDIDGSLLVILSEAEAKRVYAYLSTMSALFDLDDLEDQRLATKLSRALGLPPLEF
jgi:hypothetical protein